MQCATRHWYLHSSTTILVLREVLLSAQFLVDVCQFLHLFLLAPRRCPRPFCLLIQLLLGVKKSQHLSITEAYRHHVPTTILAFLIGPSNSCCSAISSSLLESAFEAAVQTPGPCCCCFRLVEDVALCTIGTQHI